jgi:hypothetical protein
MPLWLRILIEVDDIIWSHLPLDDATVVTTTTAVTGLSDIFQ